MEMIFCRISQNPNRDRFRLDCRLCMMDNGFGCGVSSGCVKLYKASRHNVFPNALDSTGEGAGDGSTDDGEEKQTVCCAGVLSVDDVLEDDVDEGPDINMAGGGDDPDADDPLEEDEEAEEKDEENDEDDEAAPWAELWASS